MSNIPEVKKCSNCGSVNVIKYSGKTVVAKEWRQRYLCKDCLRRFTEEVAKS